MSKRPLIDAIDNDGLQKEYEKFCQLHADCLNKNIINNSNLENPTDITLLGLSEGAAALLYKNIVSTLSEQAEKEIYTKVLNIIEEKEDKIASLVLVSKLCTEMLSKIHLIKVMSETK